MLLAFSAVPEELEVLLLSVTYGNIDVQQCLRNVVSMFFNIEKDIAWREANGRDKGFKTLRKSKPLVAVGPEHPLADDMLMADFFRTPTANRLEEAATYDTDITLTDGRDGLGGIHESVSPIL